ncbi:MAG: FeoB-associated Cys-rich membrane protein [Oscillospiraceae bacterium]|jgi:hypothetical protein|nr:FeoB-associated Cys-rich membrane protein [Oscillospiraceae bacterium]
MLSLADWVLLLIIAVCAALAIRYAWRHRGSCGGCGGRCEHCGKNGCAARKEGERPSTNPDTISE